MGEGQDICCAEGLEELQGMVMSGASLDMMLTECYAAHTICYEENKADQGAICGRSQGGFEWRGIPCTMEG